MRKFVLLLSCSLALGLAACGDDEDPIQPGGDTGDRDGGADVGGTDGGADANIDATITPDGGTCGDAMECTRSADCGEGMVCGASGCCETAATLDPCGAHLDACESETQTNDAFICDTAEGLCLQRCDYDSADDTQSIDCPRNSYCLAELTLSPDAPADALNGACIPGDCDTNIFDPDACEGTGTCYPLGNDASYCISGGTAAEGDACGTSDADEPPASDICSPGLLCFRGTCIEPCNLREGDSECGEGLSCVAAYDVTPRNQPGVCAVECEPFSGEQCGEGEACQLIPGRFGINAWMCEAFEDDANVISEAYASCSGDNDICAEGLICVGADEEAQCLPTCDPSGDSDEMFASCTGDGEVCTPSALDGFGFCNEGCDPYPRGDYTCEDDGDSCFPFIVDDSQPGEPSGFCTEDEGDVAAFGSCDNPGFIGDPCADLAVCLTVEEGDTTGVCSPLCEPFADDACPGDSTCSGVPPLLGSQELSFCIEDAQPGAVGDRCTEEGLPCAADSTVCFDTTGAGATCLEVCRAGFDDCSEGTTCETGGFNPDVVPTFMGVCL